MVLTDGEDDMTYDMQVTMALAIPFVIVPLVMLGIFAVIALQERMKGGRP